MHVRGLTASYKKRVGLSKLRFSGLSRVSKRRWLVFRRVLNTSPLQDNKAAIDDVRIALGAFNVLSAIMNEFRI